MLLAPLISFLLALSSIRTRRSAAAMAMFGTFVMLVLTLLVGWGLTRRGTPYVATYQYINISVAFSGPVNFQSFGIDLVLHADKLTVAALVVIEFCVLGILGWHGVMGRTEPGAARFYAEVEALLFACAGVLLSWDLAEMFAFWAIAGALTFLLLAHRWGLDEPARRARVALALPFITDLSLLCGIAWLYARYGVTHFDTLIPILHTNPGWTIRSLVVAAVLLSVGVAGRLALWPFSTWLTQTALTAPPAASALAQSIWPVLAIVVLFRLMPIIAASNQQTMQALIAFCGVAAVVGPLLSLLGSEPRRSMLLAGSGALAIGAAVVIHGLQYGTTTFAIVGVAAVFAIAPARAAATLAISAIAGAMRTDDLREMGDAWRRMRASSISLAFSAAVIAVGASSALAYGIPSRSRTGLVLGEAMVFIGIAALRIFLATSFGPLRRRRAFDPDRVREAPRPSIGWPYYLTIAGAVLVVVSFVPSWLTFLDGRQHPAVGLGAVVLWVAAAVVGAAVVVVAYARGKDSTLAASTAAGARLQVGTDFAAGMIERFLVAPVTDIARRLGDWIPAGDGALGRFATTTGQLAAAATRAPALPIAVGLAVVLAVLVALLAPGVAR
jgi:NADH:ubiquinone oxidoreductase subunit 5 (subunit L)/multisubunit Na+/H+ antiporter MnhA subunit